MSKTRTFGLDAIRAVAIMLVLFGHASFTYLPLTHAIDRWVMPAYFGVELFFVLSGYLICGLLADQFRRGTFRLSTFWTRRWLRTLPNYYLFLILNILLEYRLSGVWPHAGLYFVFLQNFAWPHPYFFGEAWSLTLEEIFYLLAPLAILLYRRQTRWHVHVLWLLSAWIVLFTLVRAGYVLAYDPDFDAGVRKIAWFRLDAFIYGAVAMYWHRYVGMSGKQIRALFFFGVLAIAGGVWMYAFTDRDHNYLTRTLLFSITLAGFAAMLPQAAEWRNSGLPAFVENSVRAIARWSYSIYICQIFVLRILTLLLGWNAATPLGCFIEALTFAALSILCAAGIYRFFEKPILDWRDRLTSTAKPARASA